MRTNTIKIIFLCISFMLICQACGFSDVSLYQCDVENVESIEIVELGEICVEGDYRFFDYTTLVTISDNAAFLDKLNKIPVRPSRHFTDPPTVYVGVVVIKINYLNGDYDLLTDYLQLLSRSRVFENKYTKFNTQQFKALIMEYLEE